MKFSEYSEEKRHGIRSFPIEYYYLSKEHSQYVMIPHWHKEFEMIRIISGEFRLFLNNEEHILKEGDSIIFGNGILHRGAPLDCVYECIVFDVGMLGRKNADPTDRAFLPLRNGNMELKYSIERDSSPLKRDIEELFTVMRAREPYYELRVYSLLFSLFHRLYAEGRLREAEKDQRTGKQTKRMIDLLTWIENHFSEHITLERLSEVSGMNEKYICRVFKEYTSKTPISYINELRIDCACHEMTVNNRSVTEAAYDCGFNDSGYFTKAFKKYKGISPREYKRIFSTK